jgi:hypothetical protein
MPIAPNSTVASATVHQSSPRKANRPVSTPPAHVIGGYAVHPIALNALMTKQWSDLRFYSSPVFVRGA